MMMEVHMKLSKRFRTDQQLLTIIIPRHLSRTPSIVEQVRRQFLEFAVALRSRDSLPTSAVDVFIVDTIGETNLFFDVVSSGWRFFGATIQLNRCEQDILQQLQCQPAVSRSLRSVSDLQDLVAHLETRLDIAQGDSEDAATCTTYTSGTASAADPRIELSREMADLAVSTISLHEAWLIKWLAK